MKTPIVVLAAIVGLLSSVRADTVNLNNGLIAHYTFDGNALDSSGNGNNGTINGLSWTADRFGNADSALRFDKNGYVQINNNLLLNGATSGAITGWFINRLGTNEGGFVIGAGDSRAGLDPFALGFTGDKTGSIFTQTTRGPNAPDRLVGFEAGEVTVQQNEWTSFVMQFASIGTTSIFQFYLNGALARESSYDYFLQVQYDQPMPVQIGALTGYGDSQFRGEIDDVRFYNRALNLDEIGALNVRTTSNHVPETGSVALLLGVGLIGLASMRRKIIVS